MQAPVSVLSANPARNRLFIQTSGKQEPYCQSLHHTFMVRCAVDRALCSRC